MNHSPDIRYMRRALELAAHGRGSTSPNPMVGAVIVAPDGRIIGEGFHRRCGEPHAEVNAIASVSDADRPLLTQSTMYVTLEPCSHYGKTPPCAKLIIDTGIPRVVVGATDPFKVVAGRGIAMLRDAGVEVITGIMADQSRSLNARFITAHELQRPWITLKWAQSADGFIDSDRPDGRPELFSSPLSSTIVHRLRSLHDAIAVGSETVVRDNPRLDCRLWHGRSPRPLIFDRRRRIDLAATAMPVRPDAVGDVSESLADTLRNLYRDGITSILVEGGSALLQAFINAGLWDVAQIETTRRKLSSRGTVKAPRIVAPVLAHYDLGPSVIRYCSNNPLFCVKNL